MSEMGMEGNALNGGPVGSLAELDRAGIKYSTTPIPGGSETYTVNGVTVWIPTRDVDGYMRSDLTSQQKDYLLAESNPYLAQSYKDSYRAAMGGPTGAPGGAASPGGIGGAGGTTGGGYDPVAAAQTEATTKANRDAYARLRTVLGDYGLESLGDSVQTWLVEGLSESEIVQRMRDTPQFKNRFPAIEARTKKGLAPISPGEYVAYERQARQMMRAAGIPEGFYDSSDDFQTFLVNDLSLSELGDRVTLAANAAFKMPKEARDALTKWGMSPGDLTAFWLDPDKAQPLLERKYAAAQLAGTAQRSSFGELTEQTADRLAGIGVTDAQAEQGFGALADSKELFGSLDRTEDVIGQDEQLGAVFEGNAAARRRIEQRRRKRQSVFETGGGFASNQSGLAGLGDTSAV